MDHTRLCVCVQLSPRVADRLPANMDDIDFRPSHTGRGGSLDEGRGQLDSALQHLHHHSMDLSGIVDDSQVWSPVS